MPRFTLRDLFALSAAAVAHVARRVAAVNAELVFWDAFIVMFATAAAGAGCGVFFQRTGRGAVIGFLLGILLAAALLPAFSRVRECGEQKTIAGPVCHA